MNPKIILAIIAAVVFVGLAGWLVSLRTKGVSLPTGLLPNLTENSGTPAPSPSGAGSAAAEALPVLADHMPEFAGISQWLNSAPLKQSDLRGKVVLIDFWTYTCINCIRTLPYVTSWQEKYKDMGFTVIGVHTPEFAFEKVPANVKDAIQRFKITYPVPLDNDYGTWNNYSNQYWPAEYLFDAKGRLRYTHFGEGRYDVTEQNIQALLKEAGEKAGEAVTQGPTDVDFSKIGSPETYLGYKRMEYLGSPEKVYRDALQTYSAAKNPKLNRFYFIGTWTVRSEDAIPSAFPVGLTYRYQASNANLVTGSLDGKTHRISIKLDGKPVPEDARGKDVSIASDGSTFINVSEQRLYELTNTHGKYDEHLLELEFEDSLVSVYAFTFG